MKSVLSLWLNDFFFFLVLGFGFSSTVRTRRHTSREVSGIGEISILDSAKKEKLKFIKTQGQLALLETNGTGTFGTRNICLLCPSRRPSEQIGPNWDHNSKAHFFKQTEIVN